MMFAYKLIATKVGGNVPEYQECGRDKMNVAVKPANLNKRKSDTDFCYFCYLFFIYECDKAGEEGDSKGDHMDGCEIEGMSKEGGMDAWQILPGCKIAMMKKQVKIRVILMKMELRA